MIMRLVPEPVDDEGKHVHKVLRDLFEATAI